MSDCRENRQSRHIASELIKILMRLNVKFAIPKMVHLHEFVLKNAPNKAIKELFEE